MQSWSKPAASNVSCSAATLLVTWYCAAPARACSLLEKARRVPAPALYRSALKGWLATLIIGWQSDEVDSLRRG